MLHVCVFEDNACLYIEVFFFLLVIILFLIQVLEIYKLYIKAKASRIDTKGLFFNLVV